MELLKIIQNGNILEPGRTYGDTGADVSITRVKNTDKERYAIRFKNGTSDEFGEKVVPIILGNKIFFARPAQVGRKGYKLSNVSGESDYAKNTRYITVTTNAFANFVGEYKDLVKDSESKLYYVERKRLG